MIIKPSVGRIVHFCSGGKVYPATVTRVLSEDTTVNLNVCNDALYPINKEEIPSANVLISSARYSEVHKDNTWHWPERA